MNEGITKAEAITTLELLAEMPLYNKRQKQAIKMGLKALGHEKVEWIPKTERLPEDGTWNLWTDGKGNMSVERYKYDAIDHFFPEGRWFDAEDAVAWMPLPEPYQVDNNVI